MSQPTSIDFVLHGTVEGQSITPRNIGLPQFNEFNRQVETFIGGSEKLGLDQVHLTIVEGSYILRVAVPVVAMASLTADIALLAREDALGEMDPKRADVIQKWQARAKSDPSLSFAIRPGNALPQVNVSNKTDYKIGHVQPWVSIEKYVSGQIVDMGGQQKANVHIRLGRRGKTLIVAASQHVLRDLADNRLYHSAVLHIQAEQHFTSGELRNVRLLSFVDYQPRYDEESLNRFAAAGAKAWSDVPDAAQWVREQRGG